MTYEPEVWVDHDYPPMPREYEQCNTCGGDLTLRHHCDLMRALRRILDETSWVQKRQLKAHRKSMERIRAIIAEVLGESAEQVRYSSFKLGGPRGGMRG